MITSKGNSRIRNLVALKRKASERNLQDVFLVEGIKMFREIPADRLVEVYASESFLKSEAGRKAVEAAKADAAEAGRRSVEAAKAEAGKLPGRVPGGHGVLFETVSDDVFQGLSDTQSPQGVMAVVRQKRYRFEDLLGGEKTWEAAGDRETGDDGQTREQTGGRDGAGNPGGRTPLIMVLENLQDPGNLGTIIRTAEGAGVTGILMSKGTADLYNPKVTRSTMGSIFRMPFLYTDDLAGVIGDMKKAGIAICAAHLQGKNTYDGEDYTKGTAFLIGNESRGLTDEIASLADIRVRIPMAGRVESLNASVAAAILMYEANRQRRQGRE